MEYNSKQSRPSRMIDNYFGNVSINEKKDLACEIIIELGDKEYWDKKNTDYKKRMTSVYSKQVDDLEMLVPNFKVASAIIHYDETSPHLHIVGVPIKSKNKNGMERQVGKSDVFTKESLKTLQDKMRTFAIEEFNQEYNLNNSLKKMIEIIIPIIIIHALLLKTIYNFFSLYFYHLTKKDHHLIIFKLI